MGKSSSEKLTVLVVAPCVPYPPNHGAATDIWNRLAAYRQLGYAVDLIATGTAPPDEGTLAAIESRVRDFIYVQRSRTLRAATLLHPYQIESRRNLRTAAVTRPYDVVILESEYVSAILDNPSLSFSRLVLRVHNYEPRYFRELARSCRGFLSTGFYLIESLKFEIFSGRLKRRCDQLWFISDRERQDHLKLHPADSHKVIFLPVQTKQREPVHHAHAEGVVLFVGGLTIPMNIDGIMWYVKRVHPLMRQTTGYRLVIAGLTKGERVTWLDTLEASRPEIEIFRDVPSLDALYESAAVFINPVRYGSGLKIKTIEAINAGLPVVSTDVGAEGTGLMDGIHLLIANSAEAFASGIARLLRDRQGADVLVAAARTYITEAFDQKTIVRSSIDRLMATTMPATSECEYAGSAAGAIAKP